MSGFTAKLTQRWHAFHARRWEERCPPARMDAVLQPADDPYAAAREVDRIFLGEFARLGLRTRTELSESAAARDLTLSEAGVTAWMEAARRRRLIVRWNEPSGADDRRLPEAEWELTPVGASAHQRSQWRPRFLSAGRGMWAVIAALGVLLALIQALAGKRVVPDAGLLSSVHLSGSPAVDLQPMVVAAISVLAMQASAAGRKRHWITHACRLLESQGAKSLPAPTD